MVNAVNAAHAMPGQRDATQLTRRVKEAYESPYSGVEGMLGLEVSPVDPDRAVIEPWAATVSGQILDAGSGTGRWTGHLASRGFSVEGLEPAGRLVSIAREAHPAAVFHQGSIEDLFNFTHRWDGILAWYSLIHMGPHEVPDALAALRAVLADDGSLLMSFFTGSRQEQLNHPITIAYRWPMADVVQVLRQTGFEVTEKYSSPQGPHAYVIARAVPKVL